MNPQKSRLEAWKGSQRPGHLIKFEEQLSYHTNFLKLKKAAKRLPLKYIIILSIVSKGL